MAKPDADLVLFKVLENPTKLNIILLLSRYSRMTVTQMAEHVRVGRPNLYHFVNEMVKDGLLLGPEAEVKRNYVEKYYRLNRELFESRNETERKRLLKASSPSKLNSILRSSLAAFGLELRLIAEEFARADKKTSGRIAEAVADERIAMSYSILSGEAYDYVLSEIRKIAKTVEKRWGDEKIVIGGNRMIIAMIPNLATDPSAMAK